MGYITHLHVAIAGFIAATAIAAGGLAWYGVRDGLWWAWITGVIVPVVGLAMALPLHYMGQLQLRLGEPPRADLPWDRSFTLWVPWWRYSGLAKRRQAQRKPRTSDWPGAPSASRAQGKCAELPRGAYPHLAADRRYQWTQVMRGALGSGASGSSTINTRLFVLSGTPVQPSGSSSRSVANLPAYPQLQRSSGNRFKGTGVE